MMPGGPRTSELVCPALIARLRLLTNVGPAARSSRCGREAAVRQIRCGKNSLAILVAIGTGPRALISADLGFDPTLSIGCRSETGLTLGHPDVLLHNGPVLIFGKSDDLSHLGQKFDRCRTHHMTPPKFFHGSYAPSGKASALSVATPFISLHGIHL